MKFLDGIRAFFILLLLKNTCSFSLATSSQKAFNIFDYICESQKLSKLVWDNGSNCDFNIFFIFDHPNPLKVSEPFEIFDAFPVNELLSQVQSKYPLSSLTRIEKIHGNEKIVFKSTLINRYTNSVNDQRTENKSNQSIEISTGSRKQEEKTVPEKERIHVIIVSKKPCGDTSCVSSIPTIDEIDEYLKIKKQPIRDVSGIQYFLEVLKSGNYHLLSYDFNQTLSTCLADSLCLSHESNIRKRISETNKYNLQHVWEKVNLSKKSNKKRNLISVSPKIGDQKLNNSPKELLTTKVHHLNHRERFIQTFTKKHKISKQKYLTCKSIDEAYESAENDGFDQQNDLDITSSLDDEGIQTELDKVSDNIEDIIGKREASFSDSNDSDGIIEKNIAINNTFKTNTKRYYKLKKTGCVCNEVCGITISRLAKGLKQHRECIVNYFCPNSMQGQHPGPSLGGNQQDLSKDTYSLPRNEEKINTDATQQKDPSEDTYSLPRNEEKINTDATQQKDPSKDNNFLPGNEEKNNTDATQQKDPSKDNNSLPGNEEKNNTDATQQKDPSEDTYSLPRNEEKINTDATQQKDPSEDTYSLPRNEEKINTDATQQKDPSKDNNFLPGNEEKNNTDATQQKDPSKDNNSLPGNEENNNTEAGDKPNSLNGTNESFQKIQPNRKKCITTPTTLFNKVPYFTLSCNYRNLTVNRINTRCNDMRPTIYITLGEKSTDSKDNGFVMRSAIYHVELQLNMKRILDFDIKKVEETSFAGLNGNALDQNLAHMDLNSTISNIVDYMVYDLDENCKISTSTSHLPNDAHIISLYCQNEPEKREALKLFKACYTSKYQFLSSNVLFMVKTKFLKNINYTGKTGSSLSNENSNPQSQPSKENHDSIKKNSLTKYPNDFEITSEIEDNRTKIDQSDISVMSLEVEKNSSAGNSNYFHVRTVVGLVVATSRTVPCNNNRMIKYSGNSCNDFVTNENRNHVSFFHIAADLPKNSCVEGSIVIGCIGPNKTLKSPDSFGTLSCPSPGKVVFCNSASNKQLWENLKSLSVLKVHKKMTPYKYLNQNIVFSALTNNCLDNDTPLESNCLFSIDNFLYFLLFLIFTLFVIVLLVLSLRLCCSTSYSRQDNVTINTPVDRPSP